MRSDLLDYIIVTTTIAIVTIAITNYARAESLICSDKQLTVNQYCTPKNITKVVKRITGTKIKNQKGLQVQRLVRLYPAAYLSAEQWCEQRGGLSYIQVDTLSNNLRGSWRYVCNN